MRGWVRTLLIIEIVVCFGPATAFLALGAIMIDIGHCKLTTLSGSERLTRR